ncbi:MAG: NUDIX hydrolase, partial [Planctomycetaceae bacterium]|nr:NUDIX hydrolase [Planctomycetaceae bacterium]
MKRTKRELVHKDFLTVVRNTYEAEDGRIVVREMVEHPGAAVVVPMVGKDEVLLVEQFRPGPNKPLLELPAGLLEANEDPRDCAARELEEETGYRAEKVEHLFSAYSSPGILQEQFHIFLATGLQHVG